MANSFSFQIYAATADLPKSWDQVAVDNIFLQTHYLQVLENSAPTNMQCFYIGIFEGSDLIGVALSQYLDLNRLESFGERDQCMKTYVRNFIFKNFASHVLFLGNNMITGQNGYAFSKTVDFKCISDLLLDCAQSITTYFKGKGIKIHIVSFKDFYQHCSDELKNYGFKAVYEFKTQPNMIFELQESWQNHEAYIGAFTKKYRDQYKRAHKKGDRIAIRELSLEEITTYEERIYELYHHVAKNAPFNTFFLAKNHFSVFKKHCGDRFRLTGYFLEEKLIGFHSLLLNGNVLETYFLGYDEQIQKEKMLYLNMLYNMTQFGIENRFKKIIFGRTALEIKSSVGAEPVMMSGFIYHTSAWVNRLLPRVFPKLEPTLTWQQRHPFK
ncbi:hypothetical protein GCM10022386_23110 [Flavobacterium cheonhonense]|uniref:8-amino-7-oxononanoate synthase n=1 Tax=Flavobacterium cheonhonense TaxID=706185 RepID=A0ABP7U6U3_9FLAO|nr:GNAT family N-acetyltransferase [Flavobacterium cheonhonense]